MISDGVPISEMIDALDLVGQCGDAVHIVAPWKPGEDWRLQCDRHGTEARSKRIKTACARLRAACEEHDD